SVTAVDAGIVAEYSDTAVTDVLTKLPGPEVKAESELPPEMVDALRRAADTAPIVELVNLMLAQAVQRRASDIHIDPAGATMRVRARIDGVLRELMTLPQQSRGAVVSRIKVIAGLDISVKRRPQDGRGAV